MIQFGTDADSGTIQAVTLALMPAFENNPRRLKQFLGLYRLRTYIAKQTGLLAIPEGRPRAEAMTLEQLGKFTALELRSLPLLLEAENEHGMLYRLELEALGLKPAASSWISQNGIRELFRAGLVTRRSDAGDMARRPEWSLANLDVGRLLRVSPYVVRFDSEVEGPKVSGVEASRRLKG